MKAEGKIPGILGRLGDLGGIDAKYDVAISTACGRLDNIVTDNYDTASAAIGALKQYNVGRATFITLEKIEHLRREANSRINTYVMELPLPLICPLITSFILIADQRTFPDCMI